MAAPACFIVAALSPVAVSAPDVVPPLETAPPPAPPPSLVVPPSPDKVPVPNITHWDFPKDRYYIGPFLAYTIFGAVDVNGGRLRISDALIYGVVFDFRIRGLTLFEAEYRRMQSHVQLERPFGQPVPQFGLDLNYVDVGAQVELLPGYVRPFAGASVGLTLVSPHNEFDNELRFSLALDGGVKIFTGQHVAFRAQARLTSTFFSSSSPVFCGSTGCGIGQFGLGGAGLIQGDFGLGVVAYW